MPRGVPIILVLAALAAPVAAQQRLELGDDDRWTRTEDLDPASPEGRLAAIRKALAEGRHERAELLATEWIERFPDHPLAGEAYLARGDAKLAQDDLYEALFDYEVVARAYAGSEAFVLAAHRELDIATRFVNGMKRKLWGVRWVDASTEAEELLIRIQERLPGSEIAERAALVLADWYFRQRRMALAAEMYSIFLTNFPRSTQVDLARRRLVYAHLAAFKGPEFDASGLREAKARLEAMMLDEPVAAESLGAEAIVVRIDESEARKKLVTAQWYLRTGDVIAAELTFRRLVRAYPRTAAGAEALESLRTLAPRLPRRLLESVEMYRALGLVPAADAEGDAR